MILKVVCQQRLVILDINGLLIKRALSDRTPPASNSVRLGIYRIFIRPKVRQFLKFLLKHFCCAIWSSMTHNNLKPLLGLLHREAKINEANFCFIFDQHQCFARVNVYHPSKPGVLLLTKPFTSIVVPHNIFNTLLIDDTPEKAMYNNKGTCISPTPYDGSINDDIFEAKLIPYLIALYHSRLSISEFVI